MKMLTIYFVALLMITPTFAQPVVWTQVDSALSSFGSAGSDLLGNYYYCFGGSMTDPIAQAFNLTTEHWEASTPPPLGWNRFGASCTADAIYLIGYCTTWPTFGNAVQKFTPTAGGPAGTWTQVAAYPLTTVGMAVACDAGGSYIYSAGGIDGNSMVYTNAYRYEIVTDTWSPIASLPFQMVWSGAAFIQGRFYVVGGTNMPQVLLEYDPGTNAWAERAAPPSPIYNGNGTTASDNMLYSIGGGGISYPQSNLVQLYDPISNTWSQETSLPIALGANSAHFVPPDKIISAGGYSNGQYIPVTYRGTGFPNVFGEGGETCETAVEIPAIPFTAQGNTGNNSDNYNPPFAWPGGRDVVYRYTPALDQCLDISLCNSHFDTRLMVYQTTCSGVPYRINDDGCQGPNYPWPYVSNLPGVSVTAGQTYYIVVDGFDGSSLGEYFLEIAECGPPWVPVDPCPEGTIFGQPHNEYALGWFSANTGNTCVFDNVFGLSEPICALEFWGATARADQIECDEDPLDFEIAFRTDSVGYPGTLVASYPITISREPAGEFNGYHLYRYSAPLDPCLDFSEGWLSIQTVTEQVPNCAFVWWSSPVGDCLAWQLYNGVYHRPYIDQSFCLLSTLSAEPAESGLPKQYALRQNYPNPFNATTTIAFDLPKAGDVSLRVFDVLGREVAALKHGMVEAASHRVMFDGSKLASGIYFARMEAGEFVQTRKLMLLK